MTAYIVAAWLISCSPKTIWTDHFNSPSDMSLQQMVDAMTVRNCIGIGPHVAISSYSPIYCVVNDTDEPRYFSIIQLSAGSWIELGPGVRKCGTPTS